MNEAKINELYNRCKEEIKKQTNNEEDLIIGSGNFESDIVFITEFLDEDLFDKDYVDEIREGFYNILKTLELNLDDIYVTNIVKYSPYNIDLIKGEKIKRLPEKEDVDFFIPYLLEELSIISPKIIVTLGDFTLQALLDDSNVRVKEEHGIIRDFFIKNKKMKLIPLMNPSTRNYNMNSLSDDLKNLKELIKEEIYNNKSINLEDKKDNSISNEHNNTDITNKENDEKKIITKKQEAKVTKITKTEDKEKDILIAEQEPNNNKLIKQENNTNNIKKIVLKDEKINNSQLINGKDSKKENAKTNNLQIKKINNVVNNTTVKKQIIIVYGGEGYADDPTLVIIDRISEVFEELNIKVIRFDLYKEDYSIKDFFEEFKNTKLIVLATTVEWFGIGGYMQTFLDQCWKYGNKTLFENVFLFGIVISRYGYERDTYNHLIKSWEMLGGIEGTSLCANIKTSVDLETNLDLLDIIDKKTQEFYRIAYKNNIILPTSIRVNRYYIETDEDTDEYQNDNYIEDKTEILDIEPTNLNTTYNKYLEQQKKDIKDITDILINKLSQKVNEASKKETEIIMEKYIGTDEDIKYKIQWNITDKLNKNILIEIDGEQINSYFGEEEDIDLCIQSQYQILEKIINGKITMQRAFMTGEIKAKGDFTILYKIDKLFKFKLN